MTRALLVVAMLGALTAAAPASAGTYDVWSCMGPTGAPLPASGWTPQSYGGEISSTCGRPMGQMHGALPTHDVAAGAFARWVFEAPPNTTIANVTIQRTATASAIWSAWYRSYFLFRDSPATLEGYGLDVCADLNGPCARPGDVTNPLGEASRFTSGTLRAGRLIASAQCDGQTCPAQPAGQAGSFAIYRARIGLSDAFPPTFKRAPSGSLLDSAGTLTGERVVEVEGADLGGGLQAAEIVVDGTPVARAAIGAGGNCQPPYNLPVPCPLSGTATIRLDTASLANGQRRVQVALVDAGGNRTLSDGVTVAVHNDKAPNGVPVSRTVRLAARFPSKSERRVVDRTVGFGRRVRVVGRLRDVTGAPIAGARLTVTSRLDRLGAQEEPAATIVTRQDGRFTWRAGPGPSRFLRIGYRAFGSDERLTASTELKLGVRPAIRLSVRPRRVSNGGSIHFRGRLLGGPGKQGTQIVLEAVGRRGRQRVPVTTLRAGAGGKFRFSYRFLRSFAPFTYRFQARLIPQSSYPYAAGASPVVRVKIVR